MPRRLPLTVCATLMLASWGICALSYVTQGGGGYNGFLFFNFIWVAVFLTGAATWLVLRAWRGTGTMAAAAVVSGLATLSILWLAFAIGLRG